MMWSRFSHRVGHFPGGIPAAPLHDFIASMDAHQQCQLTPSPNISAVTNDTCLFMLISQSLPRSFTVFIRAQSAP